MLRELKIDTSIHLLGRGSYALAVIWTNDYSKTVLKFISAIASGGTNGIMILTLFGVRVFLRY